MNRNIERIFRMGAVAAAVCVLCVALAACSPSGGDRQTPAQQNREYMAEVNSISAEAADALSSFSEAVSNGDVAAMRQAASDASKKLQKISGLTAPEALSQVHDEYQAGVNDLTGALSDYVEAYATLQNSSAGSQASQSQNAAAAGQQVQTDEAASSEFAAKVAEIQERYASGIEHLSNADSLVASLAGDDGSGSQGGSDGAAGSGAQGEAASGDAAQSDAQNNG